MALGTKFWHRRPAEQITEVRKNEFVISNKYAKEQQHVPPKEVPNKELSKSSEIKHSAGIKASSSQDQDPDNKEAKHCSTAESGNEHAKEISPQEGRIIMQG